MHKNEKNYLYKNFNEDNLLIQQFCKYKKYNLVKFLIKLSINICF